MSYDFDEQFKATRLFDEIVWHFRTKLPLKTHRQFVSQIEKSFVGKAAVEFLLQELPILVPDKPIKRENVIKLLRIMYDYKIFGDAVVKNGESKKFQETRIYVFTKDLNELRKPKKSRRSASFSGIRSDSKISTSQTNIVEQSFVAETPFIEPSTIRMSRRLSRSNGNIRKMIMSQEKKTEEKGRENPGFEDNLYVDEKTTPSEPNAKDDDKSKESVYDWLPFFKTKRGTGKASKTHARRSMSLDRNHLEAGAMKPPEPPKASDDSALLEPKRLTTSLSRSKIYESIARRHPINPNDVWRTEIVKRLTIISGTPPPTEWCQQIDVADVQWNSNAANIDAGIIRSRASGAHPDYPSSVVQFMEYLGEYPFSKRNAPGMEQKVSKVFGTLVSRLADLDAPLNLIESQYLVELLLKLEKFTECVDDCRAASRSSTPEERVSLVPTAYNVPPCGIRASIRRRSIVIPMESLRIRSTCDIQEEEAYKIRESWLIEAIQLILVALPTTRRRKLHKFVLFMRSLTTNQLIDIADPANGTTSTWQAVVNGLVPGVTGMQSKKHAILLTAALLANHRVLFTNPDDFVERVRSITCRTPESTGSKYAKVIKNRRSRPEVPLFEQKMADAGKKAEKNTKPATLLNRLFKR